MQISVLSIGTKFDIDYRIKAIISEKAYINIVTTINNLQPPKNVTNSNTPLSNYVFGLTNSKSKSAPILLDFIEIIDSTDYKPIVPKK
jgi:hypothetical protein